MRLFLLFIALFITNLSYAQQNVSGTVKDDTGETIPGATILELNSSNGVVTDIDGNFSISVSGSEAVLRISFLGYETQEITVGARSVIDVTLATDLQELEEVVVVGYGTVRKSDLTGAVSSVELSENEAREFSTVDQILQGRAAGVQVTQNAGSPGSGISVRIRGTNSLRGNNEPLYVVDGVIISSAGEDVNPAGGVGNSGQEVQNGLNGLNPRDIESIEVLKDASATAIYGSRGANGVVLITTKKGLSGERKINLFLNSGVRMMEDQRYDVLSGVDFARYQNEVQTMNYNSARYSIEGDNVYPILSDGSLASTPAVLHDWQDEIYQMTEHYNFGGSVSGGDSDGSYYLSFGYTDQKGLVENSRFQSGDVRYNFDKKITEKLKVDARFSGFYSNLDFAESGDLIGANQSSVRSILSNVPITNDEMEEYGNYLNTTTPLGWVEDFDDESVESRFLGSVTLTYDLPVKGLKYELRAGGNMRSKERRRFWGLNTFQGKAGNGALQISNLNTTSYQVNNLLRFNRSFNKKHRLNAVAGFTWDSRDSDTKIFAVEDFVTTALTTQQPLLGQLNSTPLATGASDTRLISYLGRANYTFNNKYVLTSTLRVDGVSKFSEENRYGYFPSFSLAWRLVQESFIDNLNVFDDLKLRAGWGQIGNHGIRPYATLSNYASNTNVLYGNTDNGVDIPIFLQNIANPDLKWETTEQVNLGLDFAFFESKVTATVDVYSKLTKDLLQNVPIPLSSGFLNVQVNRGEIENKGIEASLNAILLDNKDFTLSIGGNIAFNKTKLKNLGLPPSSILVDGSYQQLPFYEGNNVSRGNIFKYAPNVFIEGQESSLFYGFETNGIYQVNNPLPGGGIARIYDPLDDNPPEFWAGDYRIVDQNGDGVIDLQDRTIIGNPNPDFVYGINLDFSYKNLSLRILANGVYGNDIANGNLLQLNTPEGISYSNITTTAYNNAWRPERTSNTTPRIGYNTNGSIAMPDWIIEDGSFLRISNINLGYQFDKVNIYVSAQNLFTFTGYSGYNPEVTSFLYDGLRNGVDWNGQPNARKFLIGLNFNL
ncbi:MAG: SusC/RagA family protein [Flammeovirgaceae bacterium]|nr:SusC/RagA family protein [Flammeovirgaceae bacterium]